MNLDGFTETEILTAPSHWDAEMNFTKEFTGLYLHIYSIKKV